MDLGTLADEVETVRSGLRGAVDVVSDYLERAGQAQEELNAYVSIHQDEALQRAEQIDRAVALGEDPGPLAGATVALKDLIDQAGHETTAGSSFFRNQAERSAAVVTRLENAGAIIIGRSGLHEFAFGFSSENDWFGPIRNPWDPKTSPGGSSGGSAVAAAAQLASAGIGTDTGGSVRVPAALCGVIGLKVTHGRVPISDIFPLAPSLDTVGPLTRSVEDAALVYLALAGYEPADPWSAPVPVEMPDLTEPTVAGLRVGLPEPWLSEAPLSQEVLTAFEGATNRLAELGAQVDSVEDPVLQPPGWANELLSGEVTEVHRVWLDDQAYEYGPEIRERLDQASAVTLDQYVQAQAWRARLRHRVQHLFDRIDLLVTPTVPALRKVIGQTKMDVDGQAIPYRLVLSWFSFLVNHMGVPALALPLSAAEAPPSSLQLIGPWWSEHRLLEWGHALERAGLVGYQPPPFP